MAFTLAQKTVLRCGRRAEWRHARVVKAAATAQPVVVGVGGCGIDYMASVSTYPRPDQKVRTEKLELQGGGNCGNALTAASRLGLVTRIFSIIGSDAPGDAVVSEFEDDGVDTTFLLREEGGQTPFTYIIVDRKGGTRTCIHTPGAAMLPSYVTKERVSELLEGADLVYFDGRLTEAAIVVALEARQRGIPVLVEAERLRPNLETLMSVADYLVTSSHFPMDWTGEELAGDAILATALRFPHLRGMITTFGKDGALCLDFQEEAASDQVELENMRAELASRARSEQGKDRRNGAQPACLAEDGSSIYAGAVVTNGLPVQLCFNRERSQAREALSRALEASASEASANAEDGEGSSYAASLLATADTLDIMDGTSSLEDRALTAQVYYCSAAAMSPEAMVDTTGAGDAFIASVAYGLVKGRTAADMLRLGTVVAARKCTALGARPGLPQLASISPDLL